MRLAYIFALYSILASLTNAEGDTEKDQCIACNNGWCVCDDKMIQCAWATNPLYQWFLGCGNYETLILYPEMSYKTRNPLAFASQPPPKRMLNQDTFTGLDNLERLIINRHCIIDDHAFAGLKKIREVEINWKNSAVQRSSKVQIPDNGDTPILFVDSLADLSCTTKLSGSKSFVESVNAMQKKTKSLNLQCSLTRIDRNFSGGQALLYKKLKEIAKQPRSAQEGSSKAAIGSRSDSGELRPSTSSRSTSISASLDPRPPHFPALGSEGDATLVHDCSRVPIMDGAGIESDSVLVAPDVQLKRSLSVDETKSGDRSMLLSFADDTNKVQVSHSRKFSEGTLGPVIELPAENELVSQRLCNTQSLPVTITEDAASHVSSEDPDFALIEGVAELDAPFDAAQGNGKDSHSVASYSTSGKGSICNYVEMMPNRRATSDWLPAVPLGLVTELPADISELLNAENLFTGGVMENVADPPNPSPLMGNYGRSVFVGYDNWVI